MSKEYVVFYIESMIVCIIVFGILLVHDLVEGDRQERKFRFDNVLLAHIMYFSCDIVWASLRAGLITKTQINVMVVNYLLLVLLALIANTWFTFAVAMTEMPFRGTILGKLMIAAPMASTSLISAVWMVIQPSAWINENLDMTPLYQLFFLLAPMIYIVSAFFFSLYQAFKKENILNRKLYILLGIYPLTVLISGIIQILVFDLPIFCFNSMIMIILFNLMSMEAQISVDHLTGLNNRVQLMRYALQDVSIHKEGVHTFVVMADVNSFKKVNDTYGHVEGDHALVIIADELREFAKGMVELPPFIGRYGGDEFLMIMYLYPQDNVQAAAENMVRKINSSLEETCRKKKMPYILSLSIGCEELTKEDTFQTCLERADKKLYLEKKNNNIER